MRVLETGWIGVTAGWLESSGCYAFGFFLLAFLGGLCLLVRLVIVLKV